MLLTSMSRPQSLFPSFSLLAPGSDSDALQRITGRITAVQNLVFQQPGIPLPHGVSAPSQHGHTFAPCLSTCLQCGDPLVPAGHMPDDTRPARLDAADGLTGEQILHAASRNRYEDKIAEVLQFSLSDSTLGPGFRDPVATGYRLQPKRNDFIGTVISAYNGHHALIIRPDDVWIAILCQFNFFVNANAELLRANFVAHEGKKELEITAKGSRYITKKSWGRSWPVNYIVGPVSLLQRLRAHGGESVLSIEKDSGNKTLQEFIE
ncbi:hypothetical protein B0H14DRAFT_3146644 [Mycena olivaceomarginata]|nr:hypothetical protein B0H14DRAFT_3146644 [Mycena olivaceomarginata]